MKQEMKRWNGWGNIRTDYPLSEIGLDYLKEKLGKLEPLVDSSMESILSALPASRLPAHALISTDPEIRLRHPRGQSLPDWVALNSGIAAVVR